MTTSSSTLKKCSLRQQSITHTIPNTFMQETVEAIVLLLPSHEETSIATWLNEIIASFTDPLSFSDSQSHPKGWKGLHLTASLAREAKTTHPLHIWISQYTTKAIENSQLTIKPNIIICVQLDPHTGFTWHNVISFLESISAMYSAQLQQISLARHMLCLWHSLAGVSLLPSPLPIRNSDSMFSTILALYIL
ncbi:hypothetical protein JVT61DRAFT_1 [Boletus reticuloceps]|uniref:Uncharacterized protein n=1 Tax=Boletus reticuloceps TaxID=495285 RepID=A0A8I3AGF1_9AGAM|nr:hypothetical protein JVT61DRAFT_1 [Boletus reticuloceps]